MAKFSVRARAVDMLGRQQIAGIPTAIHELFKNAHDAYATRVEADFLRSQNTLIIRDDGLGMRVEDFENKWLALGTESKVRGSVAEPPWTGPKSLPERPLLGEKGIGRLAIATIAPVTLVISRAVTRDGLQDIAACLVCWPLFELPGIDIDEVQVPLNRYSSLPTRAEIAEMVDEVQKNIDHLVTDQEQQTKLNALTEVARIDPNEYDEWLAHISDEVGEDKLSIMNEHGTQFYMFNTDRLLETDIAEDDRGRAPAIKRVLLGFGNTMDPDYPAPVKAEFRDHRASGNFDELIGRDEFFSASDLERADHCFEGEFDDYGQFHGRIRIFRGEWQDYVLSWPEARGRPTRCGAFKLRLAVIQGQPSESTLDPETWAWFDKRTRRYGGLYIYRDGIRVLPYGLPDFDWLGIEFRRTISASDNFFSHRRMAGYISLNSERNGNLSEKAGREGFRENEAYRNLRSVLENWFIQVAKDFFRRNAERGDEYRETIDEKRRDAELLRRRKTKVSQLRSEFKDKLNTQLELVEADDPGKRVKEILADFTQRLNELEDSSTATKVTGSLEAEEAAVNRLAKLGTELNLARPRAFNLGKREENFYEVYSKFVAGFETSTLEPAQEEVLRTSEDWRRRMGAEVSRNERARKGIRAELARAKSEIGQLRRSAEAELNSLDSVAREQIRKLHVDHSHKVELLGVELERIDFDELSPEAARRQQRQIEKAISEDYNTIRERLVALENQIKSLGIELQQSILPEETLAAMEGRVRNLEDQVALYGDLAQAGSAVGIVGHEMENVVSGIRAAIRELRPWADGTPELGELYERLRTYFDHLDSYVGLFSPLSRRVRRKRVKVTGTSILNYVSELFSARLEDSSIELIASDEFRSFSIFTFRSTIVAAVVNIVDNAIYWIESERDSGRWIKMYVENDGIVIENGGPGIPLRTSREIFEFGVSNKPGGRGMGLAISREALSSIGLQLKLVNPGADASPKFFIGPERNTEIEVDHD